MKQLTVLSLFLVAFFLLSSCGNNATAYRTLTVVVKVGKETDKTLAAGCKIRRLECVKKYGVVRTVELEECLRTCYKVQKKWKKVVVPVINSSVAVTFGALEIARQAKKTDVTWIAKIRPGLCALIRVVTEWRDIIGKKAEGLLNLLGSVKGFVCR